jgi:hypothetical protein
MESIGGGSKKKALYIGSQKHRSHATPLPTVGMTCFLEPIFYVKKLQIKLLFVYLRHNSLILNRYGRYIYAFG